jgi:predicted transcriptional regulator
MRLKSPPKPTDAELAILQVLWSLEAATVKEVQEAFGPSTGYTTILKSLQIMTEKGLVVRDETQRAHIYRAAQSKEETQGQLLTGLMQKAFNGSAAKLVIRALNSKKASSGELDEIRKLIDQLTRK